MAILLFVLMEGITAATAQQLPDLEIYRQELPRFIKVFNSGQMALLDNSMALNESLFGMFPLDESLSKYSYIEKHTDVDLDPKRKEHSKHTDVYQIIRGPEDWQAYRRHISKDGVPLTPKQLEKQDNDQKRHDDKERENRRRTQESQARDDPRSKEKWNEKEAKAAREQAEADAQIRSMYDLQATRGELIDGRPTVLLTLTSRKNFKAGRLEDLALRFLMLKDTVIHIWITEKEHEVIKAESEVVDAPVDIDIGLLGGQLGLGRITWDKGTKVVFERRLINDEVWLPVRTTWDLNVKFRSLALFHGKGQEKLLLEYSDFRKYDVDIDLKFSDSSTPPNR